MYKGKKWSVKRDHLWFLNMKHAIKFNIYKLTGPLTNDIDHGISGPSLPQALMVCLPPDKIVQKLIQKKGSRKWSKKWLEI